MTPLEPADVVRAVADGVSRLVAGRLGQDELERQLDELAALYAETTDVRHPFAPDGEKPLRTREQLRRHFAAAPTRLTGIERFEPTAFVIHQTVDPELVVVEFRYTGTVSGKPFDIPNIFVVRVRHGEIVESRDYADHLAFARAFGD
ncbi:MAG: nuclear transport factor 2 family protein [Solirubrobacteraceae bacterium]